MTCTKFTHTRPKWFFSSHSNQTSSIAEHFSWSWICFLRPRFLQVSNSECRPLWGCFDSMWFNSLLSPTEFPLGCSFIVFSWILEVSYSFAMSLASVKVKSLSVGIHFSLIFDECNPNCLLSSQQDLHKHSLYLRFSMLWQIPHRFRFHFESYIEVYTSWILCCSWVQNMLEIPCNMYLVSFSLHLLCARYFRHPCLFLQPKSWDNFTFPPLISLLTIHWT